MNDVQTELDQVQAQRAALAAKREARLKAAEAAIALEREKKALADEEAIAELEEQHHPTHIRVVKTAAGAVVVQRPRAVEYQRFMDKLAEGATFARLLGFVRPCILFPGQEEFNALINEQPGIINQLADAAMALAGFRAKATAGE